MLLGSPGPRHDSAGAGPPGPPAGPELAAALVVADWRRRTAALYAAVRDEADPRAAHALWVEGRDRLVREHPASPVPAAERDGFAGLRIADYDPAWRFDAPVRPATPVEWAVETGTDGTVVFERVGVADLGASGSLDVWRLTSYGGGLFVPLRDAGSGPTSYGGGRYVVDTVKGADLGTGEGRIVLDLNFAYAPSCAYDPAWACPLAPEGNTLARPVPVGELNL